MWVLGSNRDYSTRANKEYSKEIPNVIKELYGIKGSWEEAFGEDAPDIYTSDFTSVCDEFISKDKPILITHMCSPSFGYSMLPKKMKIELLGYKFKWRYKI